MESEKKQVGDSQSCGTRGAEVKARKLPYAVQVSVTLHLEKGASGRTSLSGEKVHDINECASSLLHLRSIKMRKDLF